VKWEDKKYVHNFDGTVDWEVSRLGDLKGYGYNYEGLYGSGYEVIGTVPKATSGFGIN
jgi:hypothetical protein